MSDPTDEDQYRDFVRRIRSGDEQAAGELVRLYEPEIRMEIRSWLRHRNPDLRRVFDSMDICQAVLASFFVRAAVGEFDIDEPGQLVRLLVGMARNKLADEVRYHQRGRRDVRRTRPMEAAHETAAPAGETPSQLASNRERLEMIRAQLSDDERRVVELRARGLEWGAVAAEAGGTPEGRRKQLARAIARIARRLGLDIAD